MLTKTGNMHIRVNLDVKEKATPVLKEVGMSYSDLFNLVLAQVAIQRRIPFEMVGSGYFLHEDELLADAKETKLAIENGTAVMYSNMREVREALENDFN